MSILWCVHYNQCDQIGRFLEFHGNKFYNKCSPNVWWLLGQLWKPSLFKSKWWDYILGNFWKNLDYFLFQHLVTLITTNPVGVPLATWLYEDSFYLQNRCNQSKAKNVKCNRHLLGRGDLRIHTNSVWPDGRMVCSILAI